MQIFSEVKTPHNCCLLQMLSTSYGVDRNGVVYKQAIEPDIPFLSEENFNDIPNDDKVKQAVKWLKQTIVKQKR